MGRTPFVDLPITHYVKIDYDTSVPGEPGFPGANVDKAWADVLRDYPEIRDFQRGVHPTLKPIKIGHFCHPRYTEQDRCRSCRSVQAVLKHKCRRCYQREYMRVYYQTHKHLH